MSKIRYYTLPGNRVGLCEVEQQAMVKPEFRLLKVFTRKMEPVINEKTGRQLVQFFALDDIRLGRVPQ